MALRPRNDDYFNSPVPGLHFFWQETDEPPNSDWQQWMQLFEVAVLARHSISVAKITPQPAEQHPSFPAKIGDLDISPVTRKVVIWLYI